MTTLHINQSGQPLELVLEDGCIAEISEGRIVVRPSGRTVQGPWWTSLSYVYPIAPPQNPFRTTPWDQNTNGSGCAVTLERRP